jgi:hypothetical protein
MGRPLGSGDGAGSARLLQVRTRKRQCANTHWNNGIPVAQEKGIGMAARRA